MRLLRYIWLLVALVTLQTGWAQRSDYEPEFTVGVKGGTTLSRVSFTPTVTQSLLLGYTGGVSVRYIEEKFFGLIAEVNFTQCGWNETFDTDPYTYSHTLNYVTVPFLTHFFFGNRVVRGFINAGPQIGFLLSDSHTISGNWEDYTGIIVEQHDAPIDNKFDYGITGGAGVELRTKIGHFQVEGRYYYALSDFYSTTKKDYFSRAAHGVISVKVAYLFDLMK